MFAAALIAACLPAGAQTCTVPVHASPLCHDLSDAVVRARQCPGGDCCKQTLRGALSALVVGNNKYGGQLADLCTPVNDASKLADVLSAQSYNVCCLLNADKDHVEKAMTTARGHMRDLAQGNPGAARDTRLMVYLAGHGGANPSNLLGQVPRMTYFYGSGRYDSQNDYCAKSVKVMSDRGNWSRETSVHPVVVVDACRVSNSMGCEETLMAEASVRSKRMAVARVAITDGGLTEIYSTKPGEIAGDVAPGSTLGPFMTVLSTELKHTYGRRMSEIFAAVAARVRASTGDARQTPVVNHSDWSVHGGRVSWRRSAADATCLDVLNRVASVALRNDRDESCVAPFTECLSPAVAKPSGDACIVYGDAVRQARCKPPLEAVFGAFMKPCPPTSMFVAALDVEPNKSLVEVRASVPSTVVTAQASGVRVRRAIAQLGPPANAVGALREQLYDKFETTADADGVVDVNDINGPKVRLPKGRYDIACSMRRAECSPRHVAVRTPEGSPHHLVHLDRAIGTIIAAAADIVAFRFTGDAVEPTDDEEQLKRLEQLIEKYRDKPNAYIRITTEALPLIAPPAPRPDESTAVARAVERSGHLASLLRAADLTTQKIERGYHVLQPVAADAVRPVQSYIEFVAR